MKIIVSLAALLFCVSLSAKEIKLTTKNTVNFRGAVTWDSVTDVQMKLYQKVKERGKKNYPIYLVLDSPGGSIIAGESFIQYARSFKNVHTISIFAASMASAIVEALPGKRYVTDNGVLMFHRASGQFSGYFNDGEVESMLKLFKRIVGTLERRNADRIGISSADYKQKVVSEWWEYGEDAVKTNMVDEVANVSCSEELLESRELSEVKSLFGSSTSAFSGCPLIQQPVPNN